MTDQPAPYPVPAPYVVTENRRPIWPWILGGSILLLLLIVAGAATVITVVLTAGAGPRKVVMDFDLAYRTQDCELFESTLTPGFEADTFGDPFDCGGWVEYAQSLTVDGRYAYNLAIVAVAEEANTAEVTTIETDSSTDEQFSSSGTYLLVRQGDHWLIDGYRDNLP